MKTHPLQASVAFVFLLHLARIALLLSCIQRLHKPRFRVVSKFKHFVSPKVFICCKALYSSTLLRHGYRFLPGVNLSKTHATTYWLQQEVDAQVVGDVRFSAT